jgi:hypothetical protein
MSGSFHSYNTEPSNFNYQVEKYANPYGKIAGVGCDGTKSGVDATLPKYSSPFIVGGSTGYSFTDEPIGPVAGPKAPYSIIEKYDDNKVKYRNDFAPEFPSALKGGKRKVQIGCSRKIRGGRTRKSKRSRKSKSITHRKSKSIKHRKSKKSRLGGSKKRRSMRRYKMRGGLTSASDYTEGRDSSQDQPYGNKAYSFGQGLDSMLSANESALASPPPFLPYNDCGRYTRN